MVLGFPGVICSHCAGSPKAVSARGRPRRPKIVQCYSSGKEVKGLIAKTRMNMNLNKIRAIISRLLSSWLSVQYTWDFWSKENSGKATILITVGSHNDSQQ